MFQSRIIVSGVHILGLNFTFGLACVTWRTSPPSRLIHLHTQQNEKKSIETKLCSVLKIVGPSFGQRGMLSRCYCHTSLCRHKGPQDRILEHSQAHSLCFTAYFYAWAQNLRFRFPFMSKWTDGMVWWKSKGAAIVAHAIQVRKRKQCWVERIAVWR